MMFRRSVLGSLAGLTVPFACALDGCNDFRTDGSPPNGIEGGVFEAGPLDATKDAREPDADGPDAPDAPDARDAQVSEDSPLDSECPRWTKEPRDPDCSPRRVFDLEQKTVIDGSALRIAVTPSQRIAIAYNAKKTADEGQIHIVRFSGDHVSTAQLVIRQTDFDNVGVSLDIAGGGGAQDFGLAYQTIGPYNEMKYVTFDVSGPASEPEAIAGGIAEPASMALTVTPQGEIRTTYSSPAQRSIFSKAKPPGGTWQTASTVAYYPDGDDGGGGTSVPGAWQLSAMADESGSTHVAYHAPRTPNRSEPRYTQSAGSVWNNTKVLDNAVGDGQSGFSVALGLAGATRLAVFYHRPLSSSTAELLLASWTGVLMEPTILRLDQNIASEDAQAPRYRAAMAIDRWGLVHLVLARPSGVETVIEYRRQMRRGGQVTWLRDIIDDGVTSEISSAALVAIAISPNGRPHIVYYRAKDSSIVYATRSDRQM